MNPNDLLASWSTLSLDQAEARLEAGEDVEALAQLLGLEEAAELREMAHLPRSRGAREAVVLLPGIMGSLLYSIRGVTTVLWINPLLFLQGNSAYLELNQDGSGDGAPTIETVPFALEKLCYLKIGLALRRQVELFEFPYDWRLPVEANGDLLGRCLERWAGGDPDRQFTLVGHSMGGLVSRAYLARHTAQAERRVRHLIMHGTPHFGAAGAMENLITGNRMMAVIAKLNEKNTVRRLLLNLPSVYQLVPAPPDLFPAHREYPADWDLYDAAAWQLDGIRQDYLDGGRRFHRLLAGSDPQVEITQIAGCSQDTVVGVQRPSGGQTAHQMIRKEEGPDAGDGTVPLWSAVLPGATMYYIEEVHRTLPKNKAVIQATLDLIHGQTPDLWTDIPAHRQAERSRAIAEPVDAEAERIRRRLEDGSATEEELAPLFFAL